MKSKRIILSVICLLMAGLSFFTVFNKISFHKFSFAEELGEGEVLAGNLIFTPVNTVAGGKTEYKVRAAAIAAGAVEIEIPSVFNGGVVSAIAARGFLNCESLERVTIPESIKYIGEGAFGEMFYDAVEMRYVFEGCGSLEQIRYNALECEAAASSFQGCGSSSGMTVFVGKDVRSVPAEMFCEIPNMSRVVFDVDSKCERIGFRAFYCDGASCIVENFPQAVFDMGYEAFDYRICEFPAPAGSLLRRGDGAMYLGKVAVQFDARAFEGELAIDEGTVGIAAFAFSGTKEGKGSLFTRLTIPGSVKAVGENAFWACTNLTEVEIDTSSLVKLGYGAFWNTPWLDGLFDIQSSRPGSSSRGEFVYYKDICLGYVKSGARYESYDYNLEVKDGTRIIYANNGDYRLVSPVTKTLKLPDSVEYIAAYALSNEEGLTEINVPAKVRDIEFRAFQYCPLLSVTVQGSVEAVRGEAFSHVKAVEFLSRPAAGLVCESYAFDRTKVIIVPAQYVADYRAALFSRCDGVSYRERITTRDNISADGFVVNDEGCLLAYNGNEKEIVIPDAITAISDNVFENSSIAKITINRALRSIGANAFRYAQALRDVIFEQGSQCGYIGDSAFFRCQSLMNINLPEGLIEIGEGAFMYCTSLNDVHLPGSVKIVRWRAFDCGWGDDCALRLTVPAAITKLDVESNVFFGAKVVEFEGKTLFNYLAGYGGQTDAPCEYVKCILVPDGYYDYYREEFGDEANIYSQSDLAALDGFVIEERGAEPNKYGVIVSYAGRAATVILPKVTLSGAPITTIGVKAFFNNAQLVQVVIPDSIIVIDEQAFDGCTGLKRLEIHSDEVLISQQAFERIGALSGGVTVYTKALPVPHPTITYSWIKNESARWLFPASADIKLLQIETGGDAIDFRLFYASYNIDGSLNSGFCFPYVIQIMDGDKDASNYYFKHNSDNSPTTRRYPFKAVIVPDDKYESYKNSNNINWLFYTNVIYPQRMLTDSDGFFCVADGGDLRAYLCRDQEVTLPSYITSVWPPVLLGLGITAIKVEDGHQHLASEDGVLFNKDMSVLLLYPQDKAGASYTLPVSVTWVEKLAFFGCKNLHDLKADFLNVVFGWNALKDCSVGELYNGVRYCGDVVVGYDANSISGHVVVRDGTIGIASNAFAFCSELTELTLPEGLVYISQRAFYGCENFSLVHLPKTLARIGAFAFAKTKFYSNASTNAVIAGSGLEPRWLVGVKESESGNITVALDSTVITGNTGVTAGITGIADSAFTSIGLNAGKTVTLSGTFSSALLANSLRIIGKQAFWYTNVWNDPARESGGVVYFGGWVLGVKDTNISAVTLKSDTIGIAGGCFEDCQKLTSVSFAGSLGSGGVKYIGFDAFKNTGVYNSALQGVVYIGGAAVGYKGTAGKIITDVPVIAAGAFFGADARVIEAGPSTGYIGAGAFCIADSALILSALPERIKYFPYLPIKQNVFVPDGRLAEYNSSFPGIEFKAKSLLQDDVFYLSSDKRTLQKYYGTAAVVFVPYGVKAIAGGAFSGCGRIEELCLPYYSASELVTLDGAALGAQVDKIYVGASLVEAYKTAPGWLAYAGAVFAAPPKYAAAYLEDIVDGEYYNYDLTARIFNSAFAQFSDGQELTDGYVFTEGAYEITLTPYFGGKETVIKFTVDKTAPVLSGGLSDSEGAAQVAKSFSGQAADVNYLETVIYAKSDGYSAAVKTFSATDIVLGGGEGSGSLSDGTYKIVVRDKAGNESVYYVVLDNTPPVLSGGLSKSEGTAMAAKSFSGQASDDHYTETVVYAKSDGYSSAVKTFTGMDIVLSGADDGGSLSDGIYKIAVRDGAGNESVYYIIIDNSVPLIGGVYEGGVFLVPVITFDGGVSGVKSATLGGKEVASGTVLNSLYSDGLYTLTVTDNAGNVSEVSFYVNNTPVLSYGKDGGYVALGAETWLNCDALYLMVSNCDGAELTRDGYVQTLTNLAVTIGNIEEGVCVFKLRGNAGVTAEFIIHFFKSVPGIFTSVKDINGKTLNKNVTIESVVLGAEGVVTVKHDGVVIEYSPGMKLRENGVYVISVVDKAGQEATIEFEIRKRIPALYAAACALLALFIPCIILFVSKRRRKI